MCRVEDLSVKLWQRTLRLFGHVKRVGGVVFCEVGKVRVGGRWPARRPLRKKWSECVTENMNLLGVEEHVAQE